MVLQDIFEAVWLSSDIELAGRRNRAVSHRDHRLVVARNAWRLWRRAERPEWHHLGQPRRYPETFDWMA
jgi:hypothetical protein